MDDSTLRKLQLTELEILLEVDRVCKENNIRYFLSSGTLLGAIRHKGFIPWDDDVDIMMPFDDYIKFCELKNKISDKYFLQTFATDNFNHLYAKVRKNGTQMLEDGEKKDINHGIWIDIFPIVNVNNDTDFLNDINIREKKLRKVIGKINCTEKWKNLSFDKKILRFIPKRMSIQYCWNTYKKLFADNKTKEYCFYLLVSVDIYPRFKSDLFEKSVEVEFEGHMLPAPEKWDEYLTAVYGDYMTPPPPEKRNGGCHTVTHIDFGEE